MIQIQIFLKNVCWNKKNFEYESCKEFQMLQLWFWAKFCLSYVFEIIL